MRSPGIRAQSLLMIASGAAINMTMGVFIPVASLKLSAADVAPEIIGLNHSASAIATLLLSTILYRVISEFGSVRTIRLSAIVAGVAIALMALQVNIVLWFIVRPFVGVSVVMAWIARDAWFNTNLPDTVRGRWFGLNATVSSISFAIGPLIVSVIGTEGQLALHIAAGLSLAAAFLIVNVVNDVIPVSKRERISVWAVFLRAPHLIAAALVYGATTSLAQVFFPIIFVRQGESQGIGATALTAISIGQIALPWAIGWLTDRTSVRLALMICGSLLLATADVFPLVAPSQVAAWTTLIVFGGALVGIYIVSMAALGGIYEKADIAKATNTFVFVYQVGGVLGPFTGGTLIKSFGAYGVAGVMSVPIVVLLILCIVRKRERDITA